MRFAVDVPNFGDFADPRVVADLARRAEEARWRQVRWRQARSLARTRAAVRPARDRRTVR